MAGKGSWRALRQDHRNFAFRPKGPTGWVLAPRVAPGGARHGRMIELRSPLQGTVVRVLVAPEASVAAGAEVVIVESMKMEHAVEAAEAGVVAELRVEVGANIAAGDVVAVRSEEHTSELQSLMRISYAVFCLK